jgi:hypothetical protein
MVPSVSASSWPATRPFIQQLSACRTPVLITSSDVIRRWHASTHWAREEYIAQKVPTLDEVYIADTDESLLAARHTAAASGSCDAEDDDYFSDDPSGELVKSMAVSAFLADAAPTLYFARWFGFPAMSALRGDCEPYAPLLVSETTDAIDGDERRYFRLGTPGGVSSLHHDEYHNAFVQVNGSKRWWLFPPTAWQLTRGFPRGHPRARQSPRHPSFTWPTGEFQSGGGISAVTEPGDVLYVPPYWLHQTVTRERSVAVNLWSPSHEARQVSRAVGLASEFLLQAPGVLVAADRVEDEAEGPHEPHERKVRGLCMGARALRAAAASLVSAEDGASAARDLLHAIQTAQHGAHTRSMRSAGRRRRTAGGATSGDAPLKPSPSTCGAAAEMHEGGEVFSCPPLLGGALEATRELSMALAGLPAGVRELTLADVATEMAEHLATTVAPAWRGERGKARAVRCILVDLQDL